MMSESSKMSPSRDPGLFHGTVTLPIHEKLESTLSGVNIQNPGNCEGRVVVIDLGKFGGKQSSQLTRADGFQEEYMEGGMNLQRLQELELVEDFQMANLVGRLHM